MVRGWPYALRHMLCVSRSASVMVVEPDSRVLSSDGVSVPECACVLVQLEPCREHGRVCGAWRTQGPDGGAHTSWLVTHHCTACRVGCLPSNSKQGCGHVGPLM